MSANEEEAARRRANVRMKVVVKRKEERITQADSAAATKNLLLICLCSGDPRAQVPSPRTQREPHGSPLRSHARGKQQTCT